jgi:hypothetical protein
MAKGNKNAGANSKNSPVIGNNGMLTEPGDNSRFIRHALATYNLPPIDISDAKQVEERILWYFNHCFESDMKPTVKGLCNAVGIGRDTLRTWANGEYRASTHSNMIKKAYDFIEELWEDYMLNGKINPVAGIFLAKNNFGYRDSQEVVLTPNGQRLSDSDYQDIADRYKQLPTISEDE